jgi:hypothetical protein
VIKSEYEVALTYGKPKDLVESEISGIRQAQRFSQIRNILGLDEEYFWQFSSSFSDRVFGICLRATLLKCGVESQVVF